MVARALLGQVSDVDIRLLRVFRSVVEAGGVSAAELELNIGRSAISRHLKDLETRLNVVLCRRGRGGFALTDEGRHVYDATLQMLASLDTFRSKVNEVHHRMTGNLSVALFDKTVTNPESRIAEAIRLFDGRAPEVTLEVHVGNINEIQKGVMEGRFNVGVIPTHRTSPSLEYLPLFQEHMYLYAGKGHPLFDADSDQITPDILRQHKFAGLGYNSPNMEVGNRKGIERHGSCYDQEAVATLVLSGRYLGFLPDHYAASFHAQGLLRVLGRQSYTYVCDFDAITSHSPRPARVAQLFLDCLKETHDKLARRGQLGKDRPSEL